MTVLEESVELGAVPEERPAYDPNNLHPLDEEARKQDDTSLGIDWDEIIATTEDDFLAGRFAFNSADYPSHEEAMAALWRLFESVIEEVERESSSVPTAHATGP